MSKFTVLSYEWEHCRIWFMVADISGECATIIFSIIPATFLNLAHFYSEDEGIMFE
jgi:hypothetical protein